MKVYHLADLGVYARLVKSKRAKRLSISINSTGQVRVTIPLWCSYKAALKFVEEKKSWISKTVQSLESLRAEIGSTEDIDRTAAKKKLVTRLEMLAKLHGFKYNRVFIRNQKTRWGSCSGLNNINLNLNLVRLEQDLIDYVLLHELVHTKVKNHSQRFWRELDRYTDSSAKELDKQLRKYWI